MSLFVELFKEFGYSVEQFGDSYMQTMELFVFRLQNMETKPIL